MIEHPHERALLALIQGHWEQAREIVEHPGFHAAGFVEACRSSDVAPWVHVLLADGRRGLAGSEAFSALAAIRARVQRDNLLLLAQTERALDALLDAGIVPLALKGLDLLHRLYGRFDERTMTDADLLIRPRDLTRALETLERIGFRLPDEGRRRRYVRSSHHLPLDSPGPIHVSFELHWNLAQDLRFRIDAEQLFARAQPLTVAGRRILRLDDHDAVAHLLLHHFTHYFDRRLKWAVDVFKLASTEGFSWPTVVDRLRAWDATVVSGFAVRHLQKTVPDWIPDELVRALPLAAWRRALTRPLHSGHPLELFHGSDTRHVQLYLAAVMLERPWLLPRWLLHRVVRERRVGDNPLDQRPLPAAGQRRPSGTDA